MESWLSNIEINDLRNKIERDYRSGFKELSHTIKLNYTPPQIRNAALIVSSDLAELEKISESERDEGEARIKIEIHTLAEEFFAFQNRKVGAEVTNQEEIRNYYLDKIDRTIVVEAKNIKKKYPNFTLEDISLQLHRGQITGVIGKNGNGKSTLVDVLAGRTQRDSGLLKFSLGGKAESRWHIIKKSIGYVSQVIKPWSTSSDLFTQLQFEASIHGVRGDENQLAVDSIVNRLGLRKYRKNKWDTISSGYKLRFELARQLIKNPEILILDEPLANLDILAQQSLLQDFRDLTNSIGYPLSIVLTSQNIFDVESVADNIIFLDDGKITFAGSVSNLSKRNNFCCYQISIKLDLTQIKELLEAHDIEVFDVTWSGRDYSIYTPMKILPNDIIQALITENVQIEYFRNLSNSSRLLFEDKAFKLMKNEKY